MWVEGFPCVLKIQNNGFGTKGSTTLISACLDWSVPAVSLSHMSLATGKAVPPHFRTRQWPWTTLAVAQVGLGAARAAPTQPLAAGRAGSHLPQVPAGRAGGSLASLPQAAPGSQPSASWFSVFSSGTSQARPGFWIFNNLPVDVIYFHLFIFHTCYC